MSTSSAQALIVGSFRRLLLAILCIAISACSNSGDGTVTDSPVIVTPPVEELSSVVAVIDGNGGNVTLRNLSLDFAPGALTDAQQISLETQTPKADELARFRLKPAALRFNVASELRFELPDLPSTANFFWLGPDGTLTPFPSQVDDNVVSAQIRFLGYAEQDVLLVQSSEQKLEGDVPSAPMFFAAANPPDIDAASQLIVKSINCEGDVAILASLLSNLNNFEGMEEAQAIFERLSSLLQSCADINLELLQQQSCDRLGEAVTNAIIPSDTEEFLSAISKLFGASAAVQLSNATCSNVDLEQADAKIREKFAQITAILQSRLLRGNLIGEEGAEEMTGIVDLAAGCQLLSLGEICDSISDTVIPDLLDSMRNSSFADCRTTANQGLAMSQFYALGSEVNDEDKFLGFARFSLADVERDLMYCTGPSISLKVFDDALTLPDELTDQAATLQALGGLGSYNRTIRVEVPREGSLVVSGAAAALRCPDESVSNADIVYRINNVEVARLARNGLVYPLSEPPVDLVLSRVLPIAGLDPATTSDFALKISREGGLCTDSNGEILSDPFELFEVNVVLTAGNFAESEWTGTVTIEYNPEGSFDQSISKEFSTGCLFSSRADCRFTHFGSTSSSLRLDIELSSNGKIPIGTTADLTVTNVVVQGSLDFRKSNNYSEDDPGFCTIDAGAGLVGLSSEVVASPIGLWRLRVGNNGLLELTNGDIRSTFSGSTSGIGNQNIVGDSCGDLPLGFSRETLGPDPFNFAINLFPQTFTGQVDPKSNQWTGSDTKTFSGNDAACRSIATLPSLGGRPAPDTFLGSFCSATTKATWNFTRR
ncbi:MAG: hypothetical protein IPG06_16975 [Haliea sp.]|nr:hypothetical protein [Haliea sp.]